jgi:hypothetical protein
MKITLIAVFLLFLCSAAAFGQVGSAISSTPVVLEISGHPEHASVHSMATESPVIGGESVTTAHGEQPLWQFGPVSEPVSLGEVAREYRQEKLTARKAEFVFEKQGK